MGDSVVRTCSFSVKATSTSLSALEKTVPDLFDAIAGICGCWFFRGAARRTAMASDEKLGAAGLVW